MNCKFMSGGKKEIKLNSKRKHFEISGQNERIFYTAHIQDR